MQLMLIWASRTKMPQTTQFPRKFRYYPNNSIAAPMINSHQTRDQM